MIEIEKEVHNRKRSSSRRRSPIPTPIAASLTAARATRSASERCVSRKPSLTSAVAAGDVRELKLYVLVPAAACHFPGNLCHSASPMSSVKVWRVGSCRQEIGRR
jgi:hypothetical protein